MAIGIFKSLWGMTGPLEQQLERIASAGYVGIECGITPENVKTLPGLLQQYKLQWIGMLFTAGNTVQEHIASFKEQSKAVGDLGPLKVTAHTSRDRFPMDDQFRFFEAAADLESKMTFQINHETHRGRPTYAPWSTAAILQRFPSIRICADFSHWVCVCESLLGDQKESLDLAISRTRHIHARVGYEEGPQVTDPSAPEYKKHLERHLEWWDGMVAAQSKSALVTITPEFGPPGYQHTMPHTNEPIGDLWGICLWMAEVLRKRYV
jgi:sugar phosphate isomerase/epimerase